MDEASETSEPEASQDVGQVREPLDPASLNGTWEDAGRPARGLSQRAMVAGAGGGGLVLGVVAFLAFGPGAAPATPIAPKPLATVTQQAAQATAGALAPEVVGAGGVVAGDNAGTAGGVASAGNLDNAGEASDAGTHSETEPVEPPPDPVKQRAAAGLVATLKNAYAALHDSAESAQLDGALATAIDTTFTAAEKIDRRFAREFYAGFGLGRFVKHQQLTSLGSAVLARASIVATHGIDAAPYDLPGLETATSALAKPVAEAAAVAADPAAASVISGALAAPTFDEAAVLERFMALGRLPDDAVVAQEIAKASANRGSAATASDVAPDVRVFKAFLQLAMDFRLLKKAGPFYLRDRGDIYEKEKKSLKDLVAAMLATSSGDAAMAVLDPQHPQYVRMRELLAAYRGYAAANCEKLPGAWRFRQGAKGKEVIKLQERLACEGLYSGPHDGMYDGPTREAVVAFQRQHDLPEEGTVLEDTLKALNVPLSQRAKQIELALQRMREARTERMGDLFIRVNLPAFLLRVFEHGQVIREQKVIVGTNRLDDDKVALVQGHINRTKLFGSRLYQVIVNPTWILPSRVEHGELATSVEGDPEYLAKKNIKKVRLGSGQDVLVQGAGGGNVLGKVKFLLEDTNAIYLHDTDKRGLFKKRRRDFSHGCMRVEGAEEFAKWLLERDGANKADVDHAFEISRAIPFPLKAPLNLVTEYITVDLTAAGEPIFFDDIYSYDAAVWNDKLPPTVTLPWGHVLLRPRWVPLVDAKTVGEWKAQGKTAPRDLGPDGKPRKMPEKPEDKEP